MKEPVWKYSDNTKISVWRKWSDDGPFESCSVDSIEFQKWLDEGNTPEPADPLPEQTKPTLAELQAQLEAIQAQLKDLNG